MTLDFNLLDLPFIAKKLLSEPKSQVLAFYGQMGVGKTTLIKEMCRQLGVKETTQSPTFSIVNEYRGENDQIIYHFDCYRLENPEEILDMGFEDYVFQGDWIFIEWPEKIVKFLPENYLEVRLSLSLEGKREITTKQFC